MSAVLLATDCSRAVESPRSLSCFINGQWVAPEGDHVTLQYNPNGSGINSCGAASSPLLLPYSVRDASDAQVEAAVNAAVGHHSAARTSGEKNTRTMSCEEGTSTCNASTCVGSGPHQWRFMPVAERYERLQCLVPIIAQLHTALTVNDATETGVHVSVTDNINEGLAPCAAEVLLKVRNFLLAENATSIEGQHGHPIRCARVPFTPAAIIAPWNVPCGTILPKLMAALMCGCSVIVKPSERASRGIVLLVEAMVRATLPQPQPAADAADCSAALPLSSSPSSLVLPVGVLQLLTGGGRVGERLVSHPTVAAVQFTGAGSTAAAIQSELGKKLRPFLAECGGSNAIIIDTDADLGHAAAAVVQGVAALNGQWCMGISRILCHEAVRDAFQTVLEEAFRRRVVVGPSTMDVDVLRAFVHAANEAEDCDRRRRCCRGCGCGSDTGAAVRTPSSPCCCGGDGSASTASASASSSASSLRSLRQPAVSCIVSGIREELSIVGPMAFAEHKARLEEIIAASGGTSVLLGRVYTANTWGGDGGRKSANAITCGGGDGGRQHLPSPPSPSPSHENALSASSSSSSCFLQPRLIVGGDLDYLSHAELFGPAVSIFSFATLEEAVAMANKAEGQLCCYLFTAGDVGEAGDANPTRSTADVAAEASRHEQCSSAAAAEAKLAYVYDHICPLIDSGMVMINSIGFGFEVAEGLEQPMGEFVGMAGCGVDGNPEALARFFTSSKWFGVNGPRRRREE